MKGRFGFKRFVFLLLLLLLVYLSLYTWNLKTGVIDRLASNTGLEAVGLVLEPGKWTARQVTGFWTRYIYLLDVREENERLKDLTTRLAMENVRLRERAMRASRLEDLLDFEPSGTWDAFGARVLAQRLGPVGVLEAILLDKGASAGVGLDFPVVTPGGVVGRVLRVSPHYATVLLATDANSRIAVVGEKSRTTGILAGQGARQPLSVLYVPLNAPLSEGEVLVTSGLAGIFPKGIPVARISAIRRSDISLFQMVQAEPLVTLKDLEEVLVLQGGNGPGPQAMEGE